MPAAGIGVGDFYTPRSERRQKPHIASVKLCLFMFALKQNLLDPYKVLLLHLEEDFFFIFFIFLFQFKINVPCLPFGPLCISV